jgi:hypothetical protein
MCARDVNEAPPGPPPQHRASLIYFTYTSEYSPKIWLLYIEYLLFYSIFTEKLSRGSKYRAHPVVTKSSGLQYEVL